MCNYFDMDQQELEVTAELAHFTTDRDQLAAIFPAFTRMIDFFDTMREADGDALFAAMARRDSEKKREENGRQNNEKSYPIAGRPFVTAEQLRSDLPNASATDAGANTESLAALKEKMLNNAGERDGSFIVIPNVL